MIQREADAQRSMNPGNSGRVDQWTGGLNAGALQAALNQLPWLSEMTDPSLEVVDGWWNDWSAILTRFGINGGSWGNLNEVPAEILGDTGVDGSSDFPFRACSGS